MKSSFAAGWLNGMKESHSIFFAPLVGAIKGICAEIGRVTQPRTTQPAQRHGH